MAALSGDLVLKLTEEIATLENLNFIGISLLTDVTRTVHEEVLSDKITINNVENVYPSSPAEYFFKELTIQLRRYAKKCHEIFLDCIILRDLLLRDTNEDLIKKTAMIQKLQESLNAKLLVINHKISYFSKRREEERSTRTITSLLSYKRNRLSFKTPIGIFIEYAEKHFSESSKERETDNSEEIDFELHWIRLSEWQKNIYRKISKYRQNEIGKKMDEINMQISERNKKAGIAIKKLEEEEITSVPTMKTSQDLLALVSQLADLKIAIKLLMKHENESLQEKRKDKEDLQKVIFENENRLKIASTYKFPAEVKKLQNWLSANKKRLFEINKEVNEHETEEKARNDDLELIDKWASKIS